MVTVCETIINPTGLHARPASEFVVEAKKYASSIKIREAGSEAEAVNAKSVLRLLSAAFKMGTKVELIIDGPDEQEAVDALTSLIRSGFGE